MKSKSKRRTHLSMGDNQSSTNVLEEETQAITCPVCGAVAVQEKCKMICRSDVCRGRVILNCSEF
jgi:hypothetical protein